MTTKRPRSAGALALMAAAFVLLLTLSLASAASLRATSSPALENGHERDDATAQQLPAARPTRSTKKRPLTAKLAASSHPRASSGKVARKGEEDAPQIPLVGIGAGNLPHGRVPYILASALGVKKKKQQRPGKSEDDEELGYRLIDTSHAASALEVLVGRSLGRLPPSGGNGNEGDDAYHVVIKIWHTHLGYERTVRSVHDSLADILPGSSSSPTKKGKTTRRKKEGELTATAGGPDVRVHALLQYPRCYDSLFASERYVASPNHPIKYADCHSEEEALDEAIKQIGPSPLLDKDHAWKRSYRALEELYHRGTLESIGISNFGPADLAALFEVATVGPHLYQGTLHTLLTQEGLVEQLVGRGVHYQCHDAAGAVMNGREAAPRAYERLERIGALHGNNDDGGEGYGYSAVQVALGWLVHHRGAGAVSGTSDAGHLAENSPGSLAAMPRFGPREALDIETALLALVTGEDIQEDVAEEEEIDADGTPRPRTGDGTNDSGVVATVFNSLPSKSIQLFRIHPDTGEQVQLSHKIPPGRSGRVIANGDDVLVAYDGYGVVMKKFRVEGGSRGGVDFIVEA